MRAGVAVDVLYGLPDDVGVSGLRYAGDAAVVKLFHELRIVDADKEKSWRERKRQNASNIPEAMSVDKRAVTCE